MDLRKILKQVSEDLIREFDLAGDEIKVKRFWLPEYRVGIEDVTDDLKEYLQGDLGDVDSSELESYGDSLNEWKLDGMHAFWWEQSFYVNRLGVIETS